MIKTLIKIIILAVIVLIVGFTFQRIVISQEEYECKKWEAQSKQYQDFYWTDWQIKQCNQYE